MNEVLLTYFTYLDSIGWSLTVRSKKSRHYFLTRCKLFPRAKMGRHYRE